jgi:hypothetical protein
MDYKRIISMLDTEIGRLEEARQLLLFRETVDVAVTKVATRNQKGVAAPKKRVMSSEARARIAEAQHKRWAAVKKAKKKAAKKAAPAKAKKSAPKEEVKRIVSPEVRRRMADAQRKRWAAARK